STPRACRPRAMPAGEPDQVPGSRGSPGNAMPIRVTTRVPARARTHLATAATGRTGDDLPARRSAPPRVPAHGPRRALLPRAPRPRGARRRPHGVRRPSRPPAPGRLGPCLRVPRLLRGDRGAAGGGAQGALRDGAPPEPPDAPREPARRGAP